MPGNVKSYATRLILVILTHHAIVIEAHQVIFREHEGTYDNARDGIVRYHEEIYDNVRDGSVTQLNVLGLDESGETTSTPAGYTLSNALIIATVVRLQETAKTIPSLEDISSIQEAADQLQSLLQACFKKCFTYMREAYLAVFQELDQKSAKTISKKEFIKALREGRASGFLNMLYGFERQAKIRQEDGSRDKMEKAFQSLEFDNTKEITEKSFLEGIEATGWKGFRLVSEMPEAARLEELAGELRTAAEEARRAQATGPGDWANWLQQTRRAQRALLTAEGIIKE